MHNFTRGNFWLRVFFLMILFIRGKIIIIIIITRTHTILYTCMYHNKTHVMYTDFITHVLYPRYRIKIGINYDQENLAYIVI